MLEALTPENVRERARVLKRHGDREAVKDAYEKMCLALNANNELLKAAL